jgi:hypothetical protein
LAYRIEALALRQPDIYLTRRRAQGKLSAHVRSFPEVNKMENSRRRAAVFVMPLIIALVAASRIGHDIRTVDFLQIFATGTVSGVSLMGLIQTLKKKP